MAVDVLEHALGTLRHGAAVRRALALAHGAHRRRWGGSPHPGRRGSGLALRAEAIVAVGRQVDGGVDAAHHAARLALHLPGVPELGIRVLLVGGACA